MGTLKTYQVDLKNLSQGTIYEFDYVLEDDFFESVGGSEVKQGSVHVSLSVIHASSAFELNFYIDGEVTATCNRCLDDMKVPIETENRLIVTFGEAYAEISDEHVIVPEEEGSINIAWYMYEFIALAIPVKHVHEVGECNEMMASKLNELCVDETDDAGINQVSIRGERNKPVDPRWEALRNLVEDN